MEATAPLTVRESTRRAPKRTPPHDWGPRGESIGLTRLRELPLFASKGSADGLLNSHRTNGERPERGGVADYRGVDDAFDELASDAGVQWRDQPEPQAGQVGCEYGHGSI